MAKQVSVLGKIAHFQGRRDEVPNQQLAEALAKAKDRTGIAEIAQNLYNGNPNIQADCLKVLYEIGYRDPSLIVEYVDDFLGLLRSKNNRLVWGAMIGLSTIASLKAKAIGPHVESIIRTVKEGSVIAVDHGISTLATVASRERDLAMIIVPFLFNHLRTCRAKDVPQHSERMMIAISDENKTEFGKILSSRLKELSQSQLKRVQKVLRLARGQ